MLVFLLVNNSHVPKYPGIVVCGLDQFRITAATPDIDLQGSPMEKPLVIPWDSVIPGGP